MFNFVAQLVIWVLCIYGLFCIVYDSLKYNQKRKMNADMCLILTVKNAENYIENYIREMNFCLDNSNLNIIDLDSTDNTMQILKKLEERKYSIRVFNKEDGKEELKRILQ